MFSFQFNDCMSYLRLLCYINNVSTYVGGRLVLYGEHALFINILGSC